MEEANIHLLIVEDDRSVASAIVRWARRRGFTAELALDLDECRRALDEGSFDAIFVDLRLSNGVDGLDLSADLIAEDPERPVVLMTAYAGLESAQRAVGIGIFEYMTKPIDFEYFSNVVDRAIAHRSRLIASRNRHVEAVEEAHDQLLRAFEDLQEKERLLAAYGDIARLASSSLEIDEIIDNVGRHILQAGIFPNLMIALVDHDSQTVQVVRSLVHTKVRDGVVAPDSVLTLTTPVVGIPYPLDDPHILAVTARTGRMQIDGERLDDSAGVETQSKQEVAYFIPIKAGARVLAVLATASRPEEKSSMISQIESMAPVLDQFAGALDHARLYRDSLDYGAALSRINEELEREIEERKRAEEAVVRLERLGALGEMSAGVSHNLNNILTGVLGPAEMVGMLTDDPGVLREVELIMTSALRARDLVARLHQAVRGEADQLGSVDLNRSIEEAVRAGRPRWKDEPESLGRDV
jgi:ActR/RegA family two-component response regulator